MTNQTRSPTGSSSRPNADEKRKPGQPRYQPVEQADDEEIAQAQRQGRQHPDGSDEDMQADSSNQDLSDDFDEAEWMDEEGNDISPEESATEDDSNETSGGRQPGKRKGVRGGDSPRP